MIRPLRLGLAVGLGLILGVASVSAQTKKPARRKAPARMPKPTDKAPAPTPDAPPGAAPADTLKPVPAADATEPPAGADAARPPTGGAAVKPAAGGDAVKPTVGADAVKPTAGIDAVKPTASAAPDPGSGARPSVPQGSKPATAGARVPMKTDEKAGTKLEKHKLGGRDVTPEEQKKAELAFRAGGKYLNDGLFPQAVEYYREALTYWDHPAIHYNLALALINLDQPIEVHEELNKAIEFGPDPITPERHAHAKDYLKLVEGQLGNIEVSCDKVGAKVAVDGKDVFVAPGKYTAKVRVGKHTFFADKEGYNARVTAPFIGPGETFRIELKLYTDDERRRYTRKWQNTWFPYAIVGAGAAIGLGAGGIMLSAQSSYDQFNTAVARCNTDAAGCEIAANPGITNLRQSGDTKRSVSYVGYGVAGAAVATGAVLIWLNRRQAYYLTPEQLESEPSSTAIAPIISPEMTGALVQGHF
jgi:tetratricopeptide (TPR) repeat protein